MDVEGKSDIIELPAIVLDLEAGCEVLRRHPAMEAHFQCWMCGHTNPKSNAVPLQKASQEFVEALRSIPTFDESRALMVHCGDFDAKMLMKAWEECAQYSNFCDALSFDLPDLFQKWCKVNQCERPGVQCSRTDNFGQLRTRKSRRLWQKRWTG